MSDTRFNIQNMCETIKNNITKNCYVDQNTIYISYDNNIYVGKIINIFLATCFSVPISNVKIIGIFSKFNIFEYIINNNENFVVFSNFYSKQNNDAHEWIKYTYDFEKCFYKDLLEELKNNEIPAFGYIKIYQYEISEYFKILPIDFTQICQNNKTKHDKFFNKSSNDNLSEDFQSKKIRTQILFPINET